MKAINKGKSFRGLAVFLAVLLILMAAAGVVAYFSDWYTDWTKFKIVSSEEEQFDAGCGMVTGEGESVGISVAMSKIDEADFAQYGISAQAESACTITPVIAPSNATNKNVLLSVSFKDPSSAWANGKDASEYVTLNKTAAESGEAVAMSCLKPFGEQIVVRAVAEDDEEIYAECNVHYVKKIESLEIEIQNSDGTAVSAVDVLRTNATYYFAPKIVWGVGTLEYDSVYTYIGIDTNGDLADAVRAEGVGSVLETGRVQNESFEGKYSFPVGYNAMVDFYGLRGSQEVFFNKLSSWEDSLCEVTIRVEAYILDNGAICDEVGDFYADESVTACETYTTLGVPVGTVDVGVAPTDVTLDHPAVVY